MSAPAPPSAGAPVQVRPAAPADADAVAAVQSRAWRLHYADLLAPEVLEALDRDVASLAQVWRESLARPRRRGRHALVAVAGDAVVGLAVVEPHDVEHVELSALVVDPLHERQGHGSRLLAAVVDLAREDGAAVLSTWVPVPDEPRRAFLAAAGLQPDGARRELQGGRRPTAEVRMVAALAPPEDAAGG